MFQKLTYTLSPSSSAMRRISKRSTIFPECSNTSASASVTKSLYQSGAGLPGFEDDVGLPIKNKNKNSEIKALCPFKCFEMSLCCRTFRQIVLQSAAFPHEYLSTALFPTNRHLWKLVHVPATKKKLFTKWFWTWNKHLKFIEKEWSFGLHLGRLSRWTLRRKLSNAT